MTDLVDFLLARIADDREDALNFRDSGEPGWWTWERMLAECDAKRRIVVDAVVAVECGKQATAEFAGQGTARAVAELASAGAMAEALRGALAHLALPYADHPDWREEWRT